MIIFSSDHGNRFSTMRTSLTGRYEERLPLQLVVFPEWFQQKHHTLYKAFQVKWHRESIKTPRVFIRTLKLGFVLILVFTVMVKLLGKIFVLHRLLLSTKHNEWAGQHWQSTSWWGLFVCAVTCHWVVGPAVCRQWRVTGLLCHWVVGPAVCHGDIPDWT